METNSYKMISLPEVRDRVKLRLKQFNTTINDDAIDLFIMDASRDIMSKKKVEPYLLSSSLIDHGLSTSPRSFKILNSPTLK